MVSQLGTTGLRITRLTKFPRFSLTDPTRLVADSATLQKPAIVVTFNYRLNIFAFGDGKGERNLALQDQRLALKWVYEHIEEFGGDPVCCPG